MGHKFVLEENSLVFEAMFSRPEMEEAKSGKCTIENYETETVISFLQYLYSDCVNDENVIDLIRGTVGPGEHVYKRTKFEKEKYTLELLSMAHFYHVEDLILDCTEYLKANISDNNVMDVWMKAEKCANNRLCQIALYHLVESENSAVLADVPGFTEAFASHDKPLKDLLEKLSIKYIQLKVPNVMGVGNLGITVKHIATDWSGVFLVKRTDTISKLLDMICSKKGSPPKGQKYTITFTFTTKDNIPKKRQEKANEQWTFKECLICSCTDNTTLYLDIEPNK